VFSFTVSANGTLAYGGAQRIPIQLTWFNRQGKVLGTIGPPGVAPLIAISPDGSAVAVTRTDENFAAGGVGDVWLYDVARGTGSRLTFDGKRNRYPIWSPDGSRIAFLFSGEEPDTIYQKTVNGIGQKEALEKAPTGSWVPSDWSRDGRYLVGWGHNGNKSSIWVLPLSPEAAGGERKSVPYLNEGFNELNPKLSPNGQWIAYDSDETGRDEIFVQTFPKPGGKWQVSANGGTRPVWSRDGQELYFIGLDGKLMAVDVKGGPGSSFEAGAPNPLFDTHTVGDRTITFDVSKDGRFLIPTWISDLGGPITVIVNWQAALKK